MIAVKDTLVSDDLLEKKFVCDLNACKGACCVEGDGGAPLEQSELKQLADNFDVVKKYMTAEGVLAVEKNGFFEVDRNGDYETPLVEGKHCAFVFFEENGTAKCSYEKAFNKGEINFRKPVSCYLYPVRLKKIGDTIAVNYHEWDICAPACSCGSSLNVKVYKFLKQPLTERFGEEWYNELDEINTALEKVKK